MVGNFCNRTACRIRNRRRRHDDNMTLRKKKTPRASQHYVGWRAWQKSLLLPVAGEFFLLTLPFIEPFIERTNGTSAVHFQPKVEVRFTSTHVGSRIESTSTMSSPTKRK